MRRVATRLGGEGGGGVHSESYTHEARFLTRGLSRQVRVWHVCVKVCVCVRVACVVFVYMRVACVVRARVWGGHLCVCARARACTNLCVCVFV